MVVAIINPLPKGAISNTASFFSFNNSGNHLLDHFSKDPVYIFSGYVQSITRRSTDPGGNHGSWQMLLQLLWNCFDKPRSRG